MNWNAIVEKVAAYVVKIETQEGTALDFCASTTKTNPYLGLLPLATWSATQTNGSSQSGSTIFRRVLQNS